MITNEQFAEWKANPVTQEIFTELQKIRDGLFEKISYGGTIGDTADQTHGRTNRMIGHLEGIDQLLNISFAGESIIDTVNDLSGY